MTISCRPALRAVAGAAALCCLIAPPRLDAQARAAARAESPPPGWVVRTDAGGMDMGDGNRVKLVDMKPGFHVTTGPAAIVYDSTRRASGDWRLEATIHLFNPGSRAEGFGVFFGGTGLGTPAARYGYALVRRDGRALLKARDGATTRTVRDWTANGGVPVWSAARGPSVKYALAVEARGPRVTMSVNGVNVLDAARSELPADGIVGLRINHAVDVHIESFSVAPLGRR